MLKLFLPAMLAALAVLMTGPGGYAAPLQNSTEPAVAQDSTPAAPKAETNNLRWRPQRDGKDLRLQDFCFFTYKGSTLIASMMKDFCHEGIVLARSTNLSEWENLGIALKKRTPEDLSMVWAPHLVESGGIYYMFYTGVTTPVPGQWCQRILVAESRTPDRPESWVRSTNVQFTVDGKSQDWFRPCHKGSVWSDKAWADSRDPMVLKYEGVWHMFYSGHDEGAGICGVATAPSITGPWLDCGAVLKVSNTTIPESCYVMQDPEGGFVMVFNHAGAGKICVSRSRHLLPQQDQPCFERTEILSDSSNRGLKGWAHEFLPDAKAEFLSAYLTGYFIDFETVRFVKTANGWTVAPNRATTGK